MGLRAPAAPTLSSSSTAQNLISIVWARFFEILFSN
jgi:hypothetical protein